MQISQMMFQHLCLCSAFILISLCSASVRDNGQPDAMQTGTEAMAEPKNSYISDRDVDINQPVREHVDLKNSESDVGGGGFDNEKTKFNDETLKNVEEKSNVEDGSSKIYENEHSSQKTDSNSAQYSENSAHFAEGSDKESSARDESSIVEVKKEFGQSEENPLQDGREQGQIVNKADETYDCDMDNPKGGIGKEIDNKDGEDGVVSPDKSSSISDAAKSDTHEKVTLEAHHFHPQPPEADKTTGPEGQDSEPPRQRRFYPLLYTFRTLFTSFLAELSNEDSGTTVPSAINATDKSGNSTASELLDKDSNSTENGTDSSKKTRFHCSPKNITSNTTGEVKIVNSTELLEILNFSKNQKASTCVLVLFYAPWCHFCARTAPHYNALARAYPQLDILAVDTSHFSYLNARFGTVAVPNVMLFHSRSAVRFNHTSRALETFIEFVVNNTGLEPSGIVSLESMDFLGPLPNTVVKGYDWLLWLAWTFVIACSTVGFVQSRLGQGVITRLNVLWQEHQHIE